MLTGFPREEAVGKSMVKNFITAERPAAAVTILPLLPIRNMILLFIIMVLLTVSVDVTNGTTNHSNTVLQAK